MKETIQNSDDAFTPALGHTPCACPATNLLPSLPRSHIHSQCRSGRLLIEVRRRRWLHPLQDSKRSCLQSAFNPSNPGQSNVSKMQTRTRSSWNSRPSTDLLLGVPQTRLCPLRCPILISPPCQSRRRTRSISPPMSHLRPYTRRRLRTRRKIPRWPLVPPRDAIQGRIRPPYPSFLGHFLPPLQPNFVSSGIHVEPSQMTNGIPNHLIRLRTSNNSMISHSNSQIQSRRSFRLSSSSAPLKYWIRRKNSYQDARYRCQPPPCRQSSRA